MYLGCLAAIFTMLVCSCSPADKDVPCTADADCDLAPDGRCLPTESNGDTWCAYPDPGCDEGYRYSNEDVWDGASGRCVTESRQVELLVYVGGNGGGNVVSQPAGIDCGSGGVGSCTATFERGTQVQLAQTAARGEFLGWSDACRGAATCSVTLTANTTVGALFGIPGEALWFNQIGSAVGDYATQVFVDPLGSVYAGGRFSDTATVGGVELTSAGGNDSFVAKLDANTGAALWAVRFGSAGNESTEGIAVDSSGDVFVIGRFEGTVNFGGDALTSAGDNDVFVLKLDRATGAHRWSKRFGGTGNDGTGGGVVVDPAGAVVVSGAFGSPSINFGGSNLVNAGPGLGDLYLAKLSNADGTHVWSVRAGGTSRESVASIAVDQSGALVIAGEFSGTTNFGGAELVSAGMSDAFLAKYDGVSGAHLFSVRYGAAGADEISDVVADSAGKILVTGSYMGTVSFGGPSPLTATGQDVFLVRMSLSGAYEWQKSFGSTATDYAGGLTVDASNNVTVIGSFSGTINLGGEDLTSAGGAMEVFVGTFEGSTGGHLGSVRQGGTGQENGVDVAAAADGRLYCVGHFDGFAEFGGFGHVSAGGVDGFVVGLAPL